METTFAELKQKLIRLLRDEVAEEGSGGGLLGGSTYSADTLQDSIHAALFAIIARSWKPSVLSLTSAVLEADLPADIIDVEAVFDKNLGTFIPKMNTQVGQTLISSTGNGWTTYPSGKIVFLTTLSTKGADVYYSATWVKPTEDSDPIESPDYTETAILFYAASYCLLGDAVASGNLANYKTKVDSGSPVDNPAMETSTFLLRRFENELAKLPIMEKGRTF